MIFLMVYRHSQLYCSPISAGASRSASLAKQQFAQAPKVFVSFEIAKARVQTAKTCVSRTVRLMHPQSASIQCDALDRGWQCAGVGASQNFLKTSSYAAYLKDVEPLQAGSPQGTALTPMWFRLA